jgi:type III pantothenate kinase
MKVDMVVDVGNTSIKWGKCSASGVEHVATLPPNDESIWLEYWEWLKLTNDVYWAIGGVNPVTRDHLAKWLAGRTAGVKVLDSYLQLPLDVRVSEPTKVGIDRLFDAVAANSRVQREESKIIVDAGTAVTVDWVDAKGVFRGGAILPGFNLMCKALHDHTALLPKIEVSSTNPILPGFSTEGAMAAGVFWAVAGGIKALIRNLEPRMKESRDRSVFLTGGDAALLLPVMDTDVIHWPEMTLQGIRIAAEKHTGASAPLANRE